MTVERLVWPGSLTAPDGFSDSRGCVHPLHKNTKRDLSCAFPIRHTTTNLLVNSLLLSAKSLSQVKHTTGAVATAARNMQQEHATEEDAAALVIQVLLVELVQGHHLLKTAE